MNYAQLVAAIESATENTYETADIDRFIQTAERRIYNAVYLVADRKTSQLVTVSGTKTVALPADFLAIYSLSCYTTQNNSNYTYLLNKEPEFIREGYPNPATGGTPAHYAILDDTEQILLGPTPNAIFGLEIEYYYYPESITSASTTWLGDNFDFVLFDAAMIEAGVFLKYDVEVMKQFIDKYGQSLALLKNYGNGKLQQDGYRSGNARVKVF